MRFGLLIDINEEEIRLKVFGEWGNVCKPIQTCDLIPVAQDGSKGLPQRRIPFAQEDRWS